MTEATAAALPQASTVTEARIPHRFIRPLGEQIIIRTIPPLSVGSIIVPDSAKRITHKQAAGFLFQQFPAFYAKVATLPTFGTFLEEFYEYDKIAAEKQQEQK
jgi:hypothetical protein